jgi:hypothetical protein
MGWQLGVIAIALCMACGNQKPELGSEEAYVAKETADLRLAITARDQAKITVGCMSVMSSLSRGRLPAAMNTEIEQLCYDDVPRVLLEESIADAKKQQADGSVAQLGHELTCFQLYAEDALKWAAKRTTPAPAVAALIAEYERLCPEKVASYRARARAH